VISVRHAGVVVALAVMMASADAAVAARWRVQPVPRSPGGTLVGVSCTSPRACMAVGSYSGHTSRILTERWDGSRWSIVPARLPAGAIDGGFNDVSCTSDRACIAVGAYDLDARRSSTLAERWDGSRWSIQRIPDQPGVPGSFLNGVSCSSATDCMAVGDYGDPGNHGPPSVLVEHWDGSRWSVQTSRSAGGIDGFLGGVSCTSRNACTAVGGTARGAARAERWNGAVWTAQRTPAVSKRDQTFFAAVSCTSASTCTAVGTDSNRTGVFPLSQGWNGSRWSSEGAHFDGDEFTSVACTSANACTAVGDAGGGSETLAAIWNGSRWSAQPTPRDTSGRTNYTLFDVSCTSKSVCVAVGGINKAANGIATGALVERRS
jgi:hypothetical protein